MLRLLIGLRSWFSDATMDDIVALTLTFSDFIEDQLAGQLVGEPLYSLEAYLRHYIFLAQLCPDVVQKRGLAHPPRGTGCLLLT